LRFLLLYSPRWLFLYPGALLMLIGLASGLWLLSGPKHLGAVTLDVHTLLYSATAVIIGFQATLFAICTKIFAVNQGLFPEDPSWDKMFRVFTLEKGLFLGSVLSVMGLAGSIYAMSDWGLHSFGAMNPTKTLRIIIPAILSLTLGFQTILSSFFLSMLGMARR